MKLLRFLPLLVLCALSLSSVRAEQFFYPKKDSAWFSVNIPDDWKPEVSDDETLEATSPDEQGYLAFWVLKDKSDFKTLEKDLDDLISESVKDAKIKDEATTKKINGIEFMIYEGAGIDAEDEKLKVGFEVFLFEAQPGKVGLFYCEYGEKAPKSVIDSLIKIVESIKIEKK